MSSPASGDGSAIASAGGREAPAAITTNYQPLVSISHTEWQICRLYYVVANTTTTTSSSSSSSSSNGKVNSSGDITPAALTHTRRLLAGLSRIGRFVYNKESVQDLGYDIPITFNYGSRRVNYNLRDSLSLLQGLYSRPGMTAGEYDAYVTRQGWRADLQPCRSQLLPIYYWNSHKGGWTLTNFGDAVNADLARGLLPGLSKILYTSKGAGSASHSHTQAAVPGKMLMVGSVLTHANPGDVVWGSGLHFDTNKTYHLPHSRSLDIRAVRGPLTTSVLGEVSAESHPGIGFGDPAMLYPLLVPSSVRPKPKNSPIAGVDKVCCVIPHYVDLEHSKLTRRQQQLAGSMLTRVTFPDDEPVQWLSPEHEEAGRRVLEPGGGSGWRVRVLSPGLDIPHMVSEVQACDLLLSTSLHGIIFGEMFQVPTRWLFNPGLYLSSRVESSLKYNDYYLSTRRECFQHAVGVADGIRIGGLVPYSPRLWGSMARQLLRTLPYDRLCGGDSAGAVSARGLGASLVQGGSDGIDPPRDKQPIPVPVPARTMMDFSENAQSSSLFVLSVSRVIVPGFPDAFNPSIVPYGKHYLLSFRTRYREAYGRRWEDANTLGLLPLDPTSWEAVGEPRVISFMNPYSTHNQSRAHDPRLIIRPNTRELLVVYSNLFMVRASEMPAGRTRKDVNTRRVFVSSMVLPESLGVPAAAVGRREAGGITLHQGMDAMRTNSPVVLAAVEYPPDGSGRGDAAPVAPILTEQKNWVPFLYLSELYFVYRIVPHQIVQAVHPGGGDSARTVGRILHETNAAVKWKWKWGELRGRAVYETWMLCMYVRCVLCIGGTQAVQLPPVSPGRGEYITFFHSSVLMASRHSQGRRVQHYFMGAYTFQPHPPFAITRVSREPLFLPGMYDSEVDYQTYKPIKCVFPSGLLLQYNVSTSAPELVLVFGKQDFESWRVHLDLELFMANNLIDIY